MPLKVNILHWHAVARWTWGDDVDGDVSASSAREAKTRLTAR